MNIFAHIAGAVGEAAAALKTEGFLPADLVLPPTLAIEPTRDKAHGDLASNAAMILAPKTGSGPARMKPREIADKLAEKLAGHPDITKVEVAGPGFINMTLALSVWRRVVTDVLREGPRYGGSNLGQGEQPIVVGVGSRPGSEQVDIVASG